ncbi:MAG: hypothetical protein AB8F95_20870 [Bacteroidia bacterium]
MKHFTVILLSILGLSACEPQGHSPYDRPEGLFEQQYPESATSLRYLDQVPANIREAADFAAPAGPFELGLMTIRSESYNGEDTLKGAMEFDRKGNLIYETKENSYGNGSFYRYVYDESGRIAAKHTFASPLLLYSSLYFYYNSRNQISLVIREYDPGYDIPEQPTLLVKDSTVFEYRSNGQISRAGNKVFTYDAHDKCVEWKIENPAPGCGSRATHWKATYDEQGNLIDTWSNYPSVDALLLPSKAQSNSFLHDSIISEYGHLVEENTYYIEEGDTTLWSVERYEWY